MKKFVRHRKTFDSNSSQTPAGELYILDPKGGPADQEGGGLVRQLPSKLIGRLRSDLKFAAKIQVGANKANGRLKEEMAVVTRDAYVSKGVARKRLGQVIEQKIARGHESIHFFKHNVAKQKVASLKAAQIRAHEENLALQTRVERRNHELGVQKIALEAMGEVSAFDEVMLRKKDDEIDDLKHVIETLHHDLLMEKEKANELIEEKKDTQHELFRAYSTLGTLAIKSGKTSDKVLMYELNGSAEVRATQGHAMMEGEEENPKMLLTPETKTNRRGTEERTHASHRVHRSNRRPNSAQPSRRRRRPSNTHSNEQHSPTTPTTPATPTTPTPLSSADRARRRRRRQRPSSAHQSSSSRSRSCFPASFTSPSTKKEKRFPKKLHPYLERGRTYGPGWKSTASPSSSSPSSHSRHSSTPINQQATSTLPKSKYQPDPTNITMHRRKTDGKRILKIRSGFNDCYSDEHIADLLSNTMSLPQELRPTSYFPPPPPKGWQQHLKEEHDRLNSTHKKERQHRYLRWYPAVARGQDMPTPLEPSPLRAMAAEEYGPSDPRDMVAVPIRKRSSVEDMADWLELSRDRKVLMDGVGFTGENEDGIEEGPNYFHTPQVAPPPTNKKEIALLEKKEKETIPTLYAINSTHADYPNVNKAKLFQFHESTGKYIHATEQLPTSAAGLHRLEKKEQKETKEKLEQLEKKRSGIRRHNSSSRALTATTTPTSSPTVKRKKRPKSAGLSRRKSKALLDRLCNSTGSKFAGPGYRKERHVVKTSGSAKYQMERMREKIKKKAQENANDKD